MLVPVVISVVCVAAAWSKRDFFMGACFGKKERRVAKSLHTAVLVALVCLPIMKTYADDQESEKPSPAPAATPADIAPGTDAAKPADSAKPEDQAKPADPAKPEDPASDKEPANNAEATSDANATSKEAVNKDAASTEATSTDTTKKDVADKQAEKASESPGENQAPAEKQLTQPVETESPATPAAAETEAPPADDKSAKTAESADANAKTPDSILARSEAREPVKFITNVKYLTPNRPEWLETPPAYKDDFYTVAIKAGPYRSIRECEPDLQKEAERAAKDFVNQHLKSNHASTFISYSLDDMRRRNIVREQFNEKLETSMGLMNQVHAKLVFDDALRGEIDTRWAEIKSKSRLLQTGLGTGVVFLLLGTLFSYFRVDTATKGYYTGRLQFVTAGAILALVAASVLLAKWIPWM